MFQYGSNTVSVLFQWLRIGFLRKMLIPRGGAHPCNWFLHWFSQEDVDCTRQRLLFELTVCIGFLRKNVDSKRRRLLLELTFALVFTGKCWFQEVAPPLGIVFCIGFLKKLLIPRGGAYSWTWLLHWFSQEKVDSKRLRRLLELAFVPPPFLSISLPKLEVARNITCNVSQRSSNLTKKHQAKD